jgi:hypothetical protein
MMGSMDYAVGRTPQYDVFADEYLDHAGSGFSTPTTTARRAWRCLAMSLASGFLTRPAARDCMPRNWPAAARL